MIKIYNYDNWDEWHGASEGSGRSETIWLKNNETGKLGLFKFPKVKSGNSPYDTPTTSEFVSEKIASTIALDLGIRAARIEIGYRNGRLGCMSYNVLGDNEELRESIHLISNVNPSYNRLSLYDTEKDEYYSYDMIINAINSAFSSKEQRSEFIVQIILMSVFDMLIGNSDRHQNNWGIIIKKDSSNVEHNATFCPLYDNGSSLCAYIEESKISSYLGKDFVRLDALIDRQSRSLIRINNKCKDKPTHFQVVEYWYKKTPGLIRAIVDNINKVLSPEYISNMLNDYPEEILSENKKQLIQLFLLKKIELLNKIITT